MRFQVKKKTCLSISEQAVHMQGKRSGAPHNPEVTLGFHSCQLMDTSQAQGKLKPIQAYG